MMADTGRTTKDGGVHVCACVCVHVCVGIEPKDSLPLSYIPRPYFQA